MQNGSEKNILISSKFFSYTQNLIAPIAESISQIIVSVIMVYLFLVSGLSTDCYKFGIRFGFESINPINSF